MKHLIIFVLSLFFVMPSWAHEAHTNQEIKANVVASYAFDKNGYLWKVSVNDGIVEAAKSQDLGKNFGVAIKLNQQSQKVGSDGEARPKIALSSNGNIYVTWTEGLKKPFSGYIWFARSIDGGVSFEQPSIVHQDRSEITHRFDALNVAPNGEITVLWIDKRDLIAAKLAGKPYDGAAIYYAVSSDQGKTFQLEKKLADSTCECCRIATAVNPQGKVAALWRHVFEGSERDHIITEIPKKASDEIVLKRASYGHWKVDGCPHHGAAIASAGEGKHWWGYHLAYFDGNDAAPGLYSKRVDGEAWAFTPPKKFGNYKNQAGHPAILSMGEKVWLVWREIDGKNTKILGKFSDNEARDWSAEKTLLITEEKADYPHLLSDGKNPYLLWNTQKSGLKVHSLTDETF